MTNAEMQAFVREHHEMLRKAFLRLRVRLQTMAFDVLIVLDARGLAIPDEVRQRVEASPESLRARALAAPCGRRGLCARDLRPVDNSAPSSP
jgi:hypothetical protein